MDDDLRRYAFALDANIATANRLLIVEMAVALEREFGPIMRAASEDSWLKAAQGVIDKMGLEVVSWIDANNVPYLLANFPVSAERRPCFAINKESQQPNAYLSRRPLPTSGGDEGDS